MDAINSVLSLKPLGTAPETETACGKLFIHVLFTNLAATLRAVRAASVYASDLNAEIEVFVPHVVPYPLSLDNAPVPATWMERRLSALFSAFQINIQICLCRDRMEALRMKLPAKSIIVIGASRRWWAFQERHMANKLRRQGYRVILCVGRTHA